MPKKETTIPISGPPQRGPSLEARLRQETEDRLRELETRLKASHETDRAELLNSIRKLEEELERMKSSLVQVTPDPPPPPNIDPNQPGPTGLPADLQRKDHWLL